MVKGVTRRVVVVKPQDSRLFEEAIFMMRDAGTVSRDALREACTVAEEYLHAHPHKKGGRAYTIAHIYLALATGAGTVGALWGAMAYFM